jgi:hypothetical protein
MQVPQSSVVSAQIDERDGFSLGAMLACRWLDVITMAFITATPQGEGGLSCAMSGVEHVGSHQAGDG